MEELHDEITLFYGNYDVYPPQAFPIIPAHQYQLTLHSHASAYGDSDSDRTYGWADLNVVPAPISLSTPIAPS